MFCITSSQNQTFKELKQLKESKMRDTSGLFLLEGFRIVQDALLYPEQIQYLVVSQSFYEMAMDKHGQWFESLREYRMVLLSDKLFQSLSDTKSPQGLLAVMAPREYDFLDFKKTGSFFLVLDTIQDPGNMGTLIRTADATGVDLILTTKGCVDIHHPKVIRSTMGSILHVPVMKCLDAISHIQSLKENDVKMVCASPKAITSLMDCTLEGKLAVVIGNEANGISREIEDLADLWVKIPMQGRAESLNASVAGALMMYEVMRQK
jgi:RNA methyltransferase, TrmH family